MAVFLSLQSTAVAAIFLSLIILVSCLLGSHNLIRKGGKKKQACHQAPEARGALPLIGHLHLLGGPEPTHRVLGTMADKYGPIFAIKMGVNQA